VQEEIFQPLTRFASVADCKHALNKLKRAHQRKFRSNGKNDKRRLYFQCSTVIGNVIPPNRQDGGCPFFLRTTKEQDGTVIIREVNLRHTCAIEASSAAHRSKLPAPQDELEVEAAYAVRHSARGERMNAVVERMQDRGFKVPSDQARRALARESLAHEECISGETAGSLASWTVAFNKIGKGNYGEVRLSASKAVVATVAVSGAVVNMVRKGVNSPLLNTISIDASHFGGVTRERDAQTALGEDYSGLGDPEEIFGKPTSTKGRPKKTTVGLGRLLVCTGRTHASDIILIATGYVATESIETIAWFLDAIESRVALADNFGTVNFIADRSKAISSAIQRVYGDRAFLAHCIVHLRRNLIDHLSGDKKAQAIAGSHFDRCYTEPTIEGFKRAMIAFQRDCTKGHKYMSKIAPKRWTLSHLPFNCLGNLTSNDAEGTFSIVEKVKNAGDVYSSKVCLWENSSLKLAKLIDDFEKSNGMFGSPTLTSKFLDLT